MFQKSENRTRSRLEDIIKKDLKEAEWEGVGWVFVVFDRAKLHVLVYTILVFRIP